MNLYKVIVLHKDVETNAAPNAPLPPGAHAKIQVVAADIFKALEKADGIRKERHPDMRIVSIKEMASRIE